MKHRFQPKGAKIFLALIATGIITVYGDSQLHASAEGDRPSLMLSQSQSLKPGNIISYSTGEQAHIIATKQESTQSTATNPIQAIQQFSKEDDAKWYLVSIIALGLLFCGLYLVVFRVNHHGTSNPWGSLRRRRDRHSVEAEMPDGYPIKSNKYHTDQVDTTSSDDEDTTPFIDTLKQTEARNNSAIRQLQSDVHEMKAELIRLAAAIEESHKPQESTRQEVSTTADPSFAIQIKSPGGSSRPQQLFPQANESASPSAGFAAYLAGFTQADQESPAQSTTQTPLEIIIKDFQAATQNRDRSLLRRITTAELNITSESEDSLVRGSLSHTTQLRSVPGGGSYVLIAVETRNWLFPTFLTLESFNTNQPAKGIFTYERQLVSSAELKVPAEVREVGGLWEVVKQGTVIVPG